MSVTSGFFNAIDHDRLYDATQMSTLFDGIINDGVFMNIGTAMVVKAKSGMTVNVGVGRAWFNGTWTLNDSILPLTLESAEVVLARIDAIVLEVDKSDEVRACSIKVIKGVPSVNGTKPSLINGEFVHQHPLAYITIRPSVKEITQANIENCVGTSACPYVTGILQTVKADALLAQWQQQYVEWYNSLVSRANAAISSAQTSFNTAYTNFQNDSTQQLADNKTTFEAWFEQLEIVLDGDVASHLQNEINDLFRSLVEASEAIADNSRRIDNINFPIATAINSSSKNTSAAGAKAVYDLVTTTKNSLQQSFQAGVDTVYNACVAAGSTPSAKTPAAISTAIGTIDKLKSIYPGLSDCIVALSKAGISPANRIVWVPLGGYNKVISSGSWRYHTYNTNEWGLDYVRPPFNYVDTSQNGPYGTGLSLIGKVRGAQLIGFRNDSSDLSVMDTMICICY